MTLVIAEYVYLLNSTEDLDVMFIPILNTELSHIIMLITGTFLGISFLNKGNLVYKKEVEPIEKFL